MKFRRPPAALKPTCECGWQLPESVLSYLYGVIPAADHAMRGVFVGLNCPVCMRGHTFMNGEDPDAAAELERHQLELARPRGQS